MNSEILNTISQVANIVFPYFVTAVITIIVTSISYNGVTLWSVLIKYIQDRPKPCKHEFVLDSEIKVFESDHDTRPLYLKKVYICKHCFEHKIVKV